MAISCVGKSNGCRNQCAAATVSDKSPKKGVGRDVIMYPPRCNKTEAFYKAQVSEQAVSDGHVSSEEDCSSDSSMEQDITNDLHAKATLAFTSGHAEHPKTEEDARAMYCEALAESLRPFPTMPGALLNSYQPTKNVRDGVRWALFTCPFKGCQFATDDEAEYFSHCTGDIHLEQFTSINTDLIHRIGVDCNKQVTRFALLGESVDILEGKQFPRCGLSRTRRALRYMSHKFSDANVRSLICTCCGQIHQTMHAPTAWNLPRVEDDPRSILYVDAWFIRICCLWQQPRISLRAFFFLRVTG